VKLALVQVKGGVGKTTIAVNVAVQRSRAGRNVLLVDADEQSTASGFTSQRAETLGDPGYTCVKLSGADVRTQVLRMEGNYDDVVIDAGGRNTDSLRAALTIAEVAVAPFQPRSFDIWTLQTIGELVATARVYNPNLVAWAIINCADPTGANNEQAVEALSGAEAITYLDCPIGRRVAFPNASSDGLAVTELKRWDAKAPADLAALIKAIFPKE